MERQGVDVGSGVLEAILAGAGPVTVVFESGLGSPLEAWDAVAPAIAERARTLRYDHRSPQPTGRVPARTVADILGDLERLLVALALAPPYVLVGHSWGGVVARLFACGHPSDVAGLVLVDATHEAVDSRVFDLLPVISAVMNVLCRLKKVQRALIAPLCPPGSSPAYRARVEQRVQNPERRRMGLRASRAEGAAIRPAFALLKNTCPNLPPIPTYVLTAGGEKSKMARTNRAAWKVTAERAGVPYTNMATTGHMMPIESAEVVIDAICAVLDAVQRAREAQ